MRILKLDTIVLNFNKMRIRLYKNAYHVIHICTIQHNMELSIGMQTLVILQEIQNTIKYNT